MNITTAQSYRAFEWLREYSDSPGAPVEATWALFAWAAAKQPPPEPAPKEPRKLTPGELHIMGLMGRDAGLNDWCKTSRVIMKLVKELPKELVEYDELPDGSGTSRLTAEGRSVLRARGWL